MRCLKADHISPEDVDSDAYRAWVRSRVGLARRYFKAGREYLGQVQNLRCRLAGFAYTARFEGVLDMIEQDGFLLRAAYPERNGLGTLAGAGVWISISQRASNGREHVPAASLTSVQTSLTEGIMKQKSVVVIGAGIGGIVAATHLAQRGLKVTGH